MKQENNVMHTVTCTVCGGLTDCPGSMLAADRHFCADCADLLAKGYEVDELQRGLKSVFN